MRRGLLVGSVLVAAALGVAAYWYVSVAGAGAPIVVGILHSKSGPLKATELPLIDAELLAIEEINAEGGVLGRRLSPTIADGRSDPAAFAQQAQRLIASDGASVIFGCASSSCRKAVRPVVEEAGNLLIYPVSYEGLEHSPNIVYTAGPANQQVSPAVSWCVDVLKARKFFLVGSDSVWPRVVGAVASDQIKAQIGQVVGEEYVLPESTDVAAAIARIKQAAPDVVLATLEGATNAAFFEGLAASGMTAERTPVVSFSVSEDELRTLAAKDVAGHYAAWDYFQTLDRPENAAFVRRFKAKYGQDRVINDAIVAAYNGVRFWAQAVTEADSEKAEAVRKAIRRQSLDAPEGIVSIDDESLHVWRPFFVGKIRPDGQFDIVFSVSKPIRPVPYPASRPRAEWEALLERLSAGWGGAWANPARSRPQPRPAAAAAG